MDRSVSFLSLEKLNQGRESLKKLNKQLSAVRRDLYDIFNPCCHQLEKIDITHELNYFKSQFIQLKKTRKYFQKQSKNLSNQEKQVLEDQIVNVSQKIQKCKVRLQQYRQIENDIIVEAGHVANQVEALGLQNNPAAFFSNRLHQGAPNPSLAEEKKEASTKTHLR